MSLPYLEIAGLKKSFGLKPVLRGISLELAEGQRLALLGANGAGKTTLLRILACLTRPDGGRVRLDGLDITRSAQEVRMRVGCVAHAPYLYDELSARENLLFFARMYNVPRPQERADELLARVGLAQRAGQRAGTFSRGQAQRLALARALLHKPRLLLLDEPETGLDAEGREILQTLLKEHTRAGGTLLFTSHDPERACEQSDLVVMLSNGRVVYARETGKVEADEVREAYREALR